jgi:hypothetical protein
MQSDQFLDKVDGARRTWDDVVSRLPEERLAEPGADGGMSAADLIGHVLWYEREMIGLIRERALVGSDLWTLELDERNAAIRREFENRPAAEVLAEERSVWAELRPLLASLTDDELADAGRIVGLAEAIPGVAPWQLIASNTYEHQEDHVQDLRAWLDQEGRTA